MGYFLSIRWDGEMGCLIPASAEREILRLQHPLIHMLILGLSNMAASIQSVAKYNKIIVILKILVWQCLFSIVLFAESTQFV